MTSTIDLVREEVPDWRAYARPDDVFRPTAIGDPAGGVNLIALWRRSLVVARDGFVEDVRHPWGLEARLGIPVRTRVSVASAQEIVSREFA